VKLGRIKKAADAAAIAHLMMLRVVVGMLCVGMVQALSPLCTPACTKPHITMCFQKEFLVLHYKFPNVKDRQSSSASHFCFRTGGDKNLSTSSPGHIRQLHSQPGPVGVLSVVANLPMTMGGSV
jgi:hypothetical protein